MPPQAGAISYFLAECLPAGFAAAPDACFPDVLTADVTAAPVEDFADTLVVDSADTLVADFRFAFAALPFFFLPLRRFFLT